MPSVCPPRWLLASPGSFTKPASELRKPNESGLKLCGACGAERQKRIDEVADNGGLRRVRARIKKKNEQIDKLKTLIMVRAYRLCHEGRLQLQTRPRLVACPRPPGHNAWMRSAEKVTWFLSPRCPRGKLTVFLLGFCVSCPVQLAEVRRWGT